MKPNLHLLAIATLLLAASAHAQEKKIYKWVDKDGKTHISDQLPPEAVDQARKEYNASTGSLKSEIKTQLTPAEKAAADRQAQIEQEALEAAATAKRVEQGMLMNYETEQDLQRAFDERTDLLKQTVVSLKTSIQSRRAAIINVLNELADLEVIGQKPPAEKLNWVKTNHALVVRQTEQMDRLNKSYVQLVAEFADTMQKYRQMKGIAPPAETGASPAPEQQP